MMNDRQKLWPKWGRHEAMDNMFENTLGQLAPPTYMNSVEIVRFLLHSVFVLLISNYRCFFFFFL